MPRADPHTYCSALTQALKLTWPDSRIVNIACHGHSVPAGYFATPLVNTFDAYPHLLHRGLKERFPYALVNVIVTALGGESSDSGARRFAGDVLCFHPDVVTIDYTLNDRMIGLTAAEAAWRQMIEQALDAGARVILLTPTMDDTCAFPSRGADLAGHAAQIRSLANEYEVGLSDSFAAFEGYIRGGGSLSDLLSWPNHPNRAGHELAARELLRFFPAWLTADNGFL